MTTTAPEARAEKIARLNDQFRRTFAGGVVLMTAGVQALGCEAVARALADVRAFDAFTEDNDPYGEHDFGAIEFDGLKLFWKIDLYEEPDVKSADDDPVVTRVLTIMLAHEY